MAMLTFQNVSFVFAGSGSRYAWVWIESIGAWRRIRDDNFDGVTNILQLAAEAKGNGRQVDLEIDDGTNLIQWITLR